LLDASSAIAPAATIPAFISAPLSSGFVPPVSNFPNTTNVIYHAYPSGAGESSLAVTSAFLSQDQLGAQFRDFAVNSQGEINQLYQAMANMLYDIYGFGSVAMPNAPWMPAAYNLGLANHQFNYPLQSDLGY
jgi:hypothetical protein